MRNCDCNKKAEEKLREKTGDPDGSLDGLFTVDEQNKLLYFLSIPFHFRKKNKKGEFSKRKTTLSVKCSYCPFCGKKMYD